MDDRYYMSRCIELACEAERIPRLRGPYTGAVVVNNGEIVGKGHKKFLGDLMIIHSERVALMDAGFDKSQEATLYTTLDPCLPTYKTTLRACSLLIPEYKIARVVIGYGRDLDVLQRTVKFLRQRGVIVDLFNEGLEDELKRLFLG